MESRCSTVGVAMTERFWTWLAGVHARTVCLSMAVLFALSAYLVQRDDTPAGTVTPWQNISQEAKGPAVELFRVRRSTNAVNPFISEHLARLDAEKQRKAAEDTQHRLDAEKQKAAEEAQRRLEEEQRKAAEEAKRVAAEKLAAEKAVQQNQPVPKTPEPKPSPEPDPVVLVYRGMIKRTDGVIVAVVLDRKSGFESVLVVGENVAGCKVAGIGRDDLKLIRADGTEQLLQVNVPAQMGM